MVKRFLVSLFIVLILGGTATFIGYRLLYNKDERDAIVQSLKKEDISITIVEGKRREEIATEMAKAGIISERANFMRLTVSLEGKLFPDTYRFFPNSEAGDVVNKMLTTFNERLDNELPTKEQLILASIVEREAKDDSERATIAGVYLNRVKISMKLEADPTVQYARDNNSAGAQTDPVNFKFWGAITRSDYTNASSPYNTYLNVGLPPGPICNPGKQSILAAIHPATHSYYFFLHKNGQLLLSKTLAEHQAKVNAN